MSNALASAAAVLIAGMVAVAASAPPNATATTASRDQPAAGPTLEQVVDRMAAYVASYGEQAAMFVAAERYEQRVLMAGRLLRPRTLTSEFALVKASGAVGWIGYRDVVEVNGRQVADRRDRLQSLLTSSEAAQGQLRRIVAESARFNVGPIARDLNVPTTALFFFHRTRVSRFTFSHKGTTTIEGARVWRLDFRETSSPTLVMRRDGTDVPAEGTVWVVPEDGTVVRTRIRFRNFADSAPLSSLAPRSLADIEVTYRRSAEHGLWLPARMSEIYEGLIPRGTEESIAGRATGTAEYSNYRQFTTSARIVPQ